MGLQKFNKKPDNKGGRPEGSTKEEKKKSNTREVDGRPYVEEKHDEEWWHNVVTEATDDGEIADKPWIATMRDIESISEYTHTHPITVRRILEERGIHETDWEKYFEKTGQNRHDTRLPDDVRTKMEGEKKAFAVGNQSSVGKSSTNNDTDDEPTGGLAGLVNKQK